MRNLIKENLLVSPFLVFYIVNAMQLGVGVLDLAKLSRQAEQDMWISIILSGLSIHVLIWILYRILINGKGDIIAIHRELFGKWVGGTLSLIFTLYILMLGLTVLRVYVEIIQLWVFPEISIWFFCLVVLLVVGYFVINGFRVITGICFLSTLYMLPLLLSFLFPLKFAHFSNLFPIMDHSISDILVSAKVGTLSMTGFELLLIFYPFIKHPEKSQKWAHFAVLFTTFIFVYIAIITIVYYHQDQLKHIVWSTIMFWKIIELPGIERFEHFGIAAWLFIVLPIICLTIWSAHRGLIQIFPVNKRFLLVVILFFLVVAVGMIEKRTSIEKLRSIAGDAGFYFIYGYIPFLFIAQKIIYKLKGAKQKQ
ncbi:GerAB/ArcD/ProY family transporter [Bacillus sp. JJ1532]|uniref:GerAB/ArcD/ProY family transporter n=1 Tax=Bacillus sp. JJ1532 TaxID=3122958 RepID=UPI0030007465